jgi:hypothetical protein
MECFNNISLARMVTNTLAYHSKMLKIDKQLYISACFDSIFIKHNLLVIKQLE